MEFQNSFPLETNCSIIYYQDLLFWPNNIYSIIPLEEHRPLVFPIDSSSLGLRLPKSTLVGSNASKYNVMLWHFFLLPANMIIIHLLER